MLKLISVLSGTIAFIIVIILIFNHGSYIKSIEISLNQLLKFRIITEKDQPKKADQKRNQK